MSDNKQSEMRNIGQKMAESLQQQFNQLQVDRNSVDATTPEQHLLNVEHVMSSTAKYNGTSDEKVKQYITEIKNSVHYPHIFTDGETYVGTQPIFVINNKDDKLIKIDKDAPAIISHIGKNSVSGPGVFTQNIPDIGPVWNEDGTLIGYLEHMIRNNPYQFKNNELARVIEIISYLDAPNTNYTRRRQFIATGSLSRIRRPGLQVHEKKKKKTDSGESGKAARRALFEVLSTDLNEMFVTLALKIIK